MDIPTVLQTWPLQAVAAIIAGVVVLLVPRILHYAVAAYLLLVGALGRLHFPELAVHCSLLVGWVGKPPVRRRNFPPGEGTLPPRGVSRAGPSRSAYFFIAGLFV